VNPELSPGTPTTRGRYYLAKTFLWAMRIGIVIMLIVAGTLYYQRNHQTDEQTEIIRYVEIEIPVLLQAEAPILARIQELLHSRDLKPDEARKLFVEELMPELVRLRRVAEAPVRAAKTPLVKGLAEEYLAVLEELIAGCRTAIRVIDDPKLDAREGLEQVFAAFRKAAQRNLAWRRAVDAATDKVGLKHPARPS